ncbi:hypothetical protein C7T35_01250 [Variovorax sp. WS11]|uniref:hypothetical protein n=1 Tax=Variovorax sp. WS11 TaxID=1105204 RepID=UPI000D0CFAB6|nr:hypothetical protein [Variovorax sp. WS11]NDZ11522.1 hypothetical protein [Variovorax sp. WS11]PSL86623.1 hypothetical protein C7T35_01250 [Variovorax sp. WS11]
MKCRPGDLALTYGAPTDNGLLVEVAEVGELPPSLKLEWGPFWRVTSLGSPFHMEPHQRSQTAIWPDRLLHPIRNPGDDAIDWASHRTPRSADLRQEQLARARHQLLEVASS